MFLTFKVECRYNLLVTNILPHATDYLLSVLQTPYWNNSNHKTLFPVKMMDIVTGI